MFSLESGNVLHGHTYLYFILFPSICTFFFFFLNRDNLCVVFFFIICFCFSSLHRVLISLFFFSFLFSVVFVCFSCSLFFFLITKKLPQFILWLCQSVYMAPACYDSKVLDLEHHLESFDILTSIADMNVWFFKALSTFKEVVTSSRQNSCDGWATPLTSVRF